MTSEMTLLRKEDLSLYYYIKNSILCDFIEQDLNVQLEYMELMSTTNSYVFEAQSVADPNPVEHGRGWVYFDTSSGTNCSGDMSTIEQSSRVVVYNVNGEIIPDDEYMIDYIDGRVITSGTTSSGLPAAVDYYWNYVAVVDEWSAVEAAKAPVLVIDIYGSDKEGYQLGPGKKVIRKVDIHVFASSPAERNDLVNKLFDGFYLKSSPIFDFPEGGVLDYDGTFYGRRENMNKVTTPFNRTRVSNVIGNMEFNKVTSRHVNLPLIMTRGTDEVMLSDLNAYRSKVSFETTYYTHV